jgi:hypothetical protein
VTRPYLFARSVAAAGLLFLAACGGGSSGPSSAPVAVDGFTDQPVAAAFDPPAPRRGQNVTVTAPGYLPRVQVLDDAPVRLWPGDEAYVRALVYGDLAASGRLTRWNRSFVLSVPPGAESVAAEVAAEVSRTTGLSITLGAGSDVAVTVDPGDPFFASRPQATAVTRTLATSNMVVSATIVFRSRSTLLEGHRTLLHEVGHALGLSHSPRTDDVMFEVDQPNQRRFSEREQIALRMMYAHRRPGNSPPDRDPAVTGF